MVRLEVIHLLPSHFGGIESVSCRSQPFQSIGRVHDPRSIGQHEGYFRATHDHFLLHSSWSGVLQPSIHPQALMLRPFAFDRGERAGALNRAIGFRLTESHRVISHMQNFSAVIAGGPQPQQECVVLAQVCRPSVCLDEIAMTEAPGELSSKSPRLPGSYLNPFPLGIAEPRKRPGFKVGNVHRHGMYRTSNFQLQWIQGVNDCTKILR